MGESQGTGVGAGGFAGAAGFAGTAAAGVAGAAAAGFGSPSGGGEAGDLDSSGIARNAQTSGLKASGENVNFYQLEDTVSTRLARKNQDDAPNGAARTLYASLRLIVLDQIADALGVPFAMAVARDGVGTAGGFDANLGPENTG